MDLEKLDLCTQMFFLFSSRSNRSRCKLLCFALSNVHQLDKVNEWSSPESASAVETSRTTGNNCVLGSFDSAVTVVVVRELGAFVIFVVAEIS